MICGKSYSSGLKNHCRNCTRLWNMVTDVRPESQVCPPEKNTLPLFNFLSVIYLQCQHRSGGHSKDKRNEERKRNKELNPRYTVTDQLPQVFSCITLNLQCVEKNIHLSPNKTRFKSHQTLNIRVKRKDLSL